MDGQLPMDNRTSVCTGSLELTRQLWLLAQRGFSKDLSLALKILSFTNFNLSIAKEILPQIQPMLLTLPLPASPIGLKVNGG